MRRFYLVAQFLSKCLKFWKSFWAPNIDGSSLGAFRVFYFLMGTLMIGKIRFDKYLYTEEHWAPVGIFRIFNGPFLTESNYDLIYTIWLVAAVLSALGLCYRFSSIVALASLMTVVGYDYNFGHVHHSAHIYIFAGLVLTFSPAGHFFSIDNIFRKNLSPLDSWAAGLTMRLIMVHVVWIMMTNACAKLYHSGLEWIFSDNLLFQVFYIMNVPHRTEWMMTNVPWIFQILAGVTIFLQASSFVALANKYTAGFYIVGWSCFHFGITLVMGGHTAFYSQIVVYMCFMFFFFDKKVGASVRSFQKKSAAILGISVNLFGSTQGPRNN